MRPSLINVNYLTVNKHSYNPTALERLMLAIPPGLTKADNAKLKLTALSCLLHKLQLELQGPAGHHR